LAAILAVLTVPAASAAFDWPEFRTTPPEQKRFTLIRHLHYRERRYSPPYRMETMKGPQKMYAGPEAMLVAQLSAMKALDYDWWLDTWDRAARAKYEAADAADEAARDRRLARWKKAYTGRQFELVRWIEFDRRVVLTFRARGGRTKAPEQARAFALDRGLWKATLGLEPDPGTSRFIEGRAERIVR